jgi:hypothetical protein
VFSLAIVIIVILNLYTLTIAYPTLNKPLNLGNGDLPRDFSVYYIAGWRMLHNPSKIFTVGALPDGEPQILPQITPFKYLPSFLVLTSPLQNLSYYQAFWVFDAIQFALLPLMSFLLYKILENKKPAIAMAILVAVLLLPYPMPGRGLSVSYYMSWAEGQAKILLSAILLLSFFLGFKSKPQLSGIAFALGAFDPRFAFLALPLFLFYNKDKLKKAIVPMVLVLVGANFLVFYPGVAADFFGMVFGSGTTTPLYTPAWIPTVMLVALIAVNARAMINTVRKHFGQKSIISF